MTTTVPERPDGELTDVIDALADALLQVLECEDEVDAEYEAWAARMASLCTAEYVTGGHDPYGTTCAQERGHDGLHRGPDPFGGDDEVEWAGGGIAGGDRLPYSQVKRVYATGRRETEACQAGTPGCSIDHTQDRGDGCATW